MRKKGIVLVCMLALLVLPLIAQAQQAAIACEPENVVVVIGATKPLKLTITPREARKAGVTYRSTNETVATVDSQGRVKGITEGTCEVEITSHADETVRVRVPVQVAKPVEKLTAALENAALDVGQTARIACTYAPQDATLKQSTFHSSDEKVAQVDEAGLVTAVGKGQVTITVRSVDGQARARLSLRVNQPPTALKLNKDRLMLPVGKRASLKPTVLPRNADSKKVVWISADESIAKVDKQGQVTAVALGSTMITVTCATAPAVTAAVPVSVIQLAEKVQFSQKTYQVNVGETTQLSVAVLPQETSHKEVTYKVKNPKIATVDENGVVTAHQKGKTTVTATAADGSRHHATATIEVLVPVTGVHFEHTGVRVGKGSYTYVTAVLEPHDASNRRMSWQTSEKGVVTLRGDTNKVRVTGKQWGRVTLTGTTEDGGYSASIDVNVGSLRHAVTVKSIEIRDGKPYIVLKNNSNMYITSVSYLITGTDEQNNPIRMSTRGNTLHGSYDVTLAPGQTTEHGRFTFYDLAKYRNLQNVSIAITGWETDTGYYTNTGDMRYSYDISEKQLEWTSYQTDLYKEIQENPRAN